MKQAFLTIVAAALAWPKPGWFHDAGAGLLPDIVRGHARGIIRCALRNWLDFRESTPLSNDQRTKVGAMIEKHRDEVRALVARDRDARRGLEAAAKNDGADAANTREPADKIASVARDCALFSARIGSEVRRLLTAEQQKRIEAARKEVRELVDAAQGFRELRLRKARDARDQVRDALTRVAKHLPEAKQKLLRERASDRLRPWGLMIDEKESPK